MCHYEKGAQNEIAIVFSCPGAKEKQENKPAAGQTGVNLERLFTILSSMKYKQRFKWTRNDVTITNAWSKVEYQRLTKRTEPSVSEVLETQNLLRLAQELRIINHVIICCGDRAYNAVTNLECLKEINPFVKVIRIRHLGFQSLNRIKYDIYNKPIHSAKEMMKLGDTRAKNLIGEENTIRRLEVIAQEIMNGLI